MLASHGRSCHSAPARIAGDTDVPRVDVVARRDRDDILPGLVQRRPQQVVHGAVDDGEAAALGVLQVLHAGQEDPGVGGNRAPRLQQQFLRPVRHVLQQGAGIDVR